MCTMKRYNENISQYAEEVIFRIVYASFSDFVSKYIENFKERFPETSFRERVITQEEEQIVDIDTIATYLDVTLEDVLKERVYVLKTKIHQCDFSVFIGCQYLVVKMDLKGKDISEESKCDLAQMLNTQSIKDNIEIVDFNCQIIHSITAPTEDALGEILDMGVFKGIDADVKNSRYADSYLRENCNIQLTRELRDIIFEDDSKGVYANILCSFSVEEVKNEYLPDDIERYLSVVKQETTQCFKFKTNEE